MPLPDGSIFTVSYLGDWTYSTNCIIYWDNNNKEIKSRSLLDENDKYKHLKIQIFWEFLKMDM